MENPEVVFLSAPYTFPPSASLALSMFKARLAEEGMRASVYYPMFRMTQLMGEELCRRLSKLTSNTLFEEFIFAHLTGMRGIRSPEEFAAAAAGRDPMIDPGRFTRLLREAMAAAEICTEEAAQRIVSLRPRLLAASSLFTQNNGSLAILKRVRELDPDIRTMLGGVNCSGGAGADPNSPENAMFSPKSGGGDHFFADSKDGTFLNPKQPEDGVFFNPKSPEKH